MATYPMVKFVASPSTSAALRYDFNLTTQTVKTHILNDGFDLGAPALEGEPDGIGVEYGMREIRFTQRIEGTRVNAMAKQSAIARELLRTDNWLIVQMASDREAVWFHTYRASPGSLSFENADTDDGIDAWDVGVTLSAEPFAFGARVTLSPITITNNPAAGANPCFYAFPTILGDAPAPLRIDADFSASHHGSDILWSSAAVDGTYSAPVVWQVGTGDGWTAGTDTAAATVDAAYSGGSYRAVSFATVATMATRISGSAPSTPRAGRYRVMLRVARSDLNSTFAFKFGQSVSLAYVFGDTANMARLASGANGHANWVDMGVFSFPDGLPDADANDLGAPQPPDIAVQAQRLSGAGSARLDAIMLVPVALAGERADCRVMLTAFPTLGPNSAFVANRWDGDKAYSAGINSSGFFAPYGRDVAMRGGFPQVVPGATNVLHHLTRCSDRIGFVGADNPDVITTTTDVTFSYYPRWLYIGDG